MRFFLLIGLFFAAVFAQENIEDALEGTDLLNNDEVAAADPSELDIIDPETKTEDDEEENESPDSEDEPEAEAEPEAEKEPVPEREGFSGGSFVGGIVFAVVVMGLAIVGYRYWQSQRNML
ncbi:unnamed protein product [Oikopleura dioica]|uniref:Syndecan/Neurexin domain-containing protein n=1 Tax=Oikopleura dioica TaxID=34765 RepID=E4YAN8_OIKDI|nr:unnamed protein product [Oikopleura dioica]